MYDHLFQPETNHANVLLERSSAQNLTLPLQPPTQYTLSCGVTVRLKPVAPLFIQRIAKSVPLPPRPTYTAVTASGREEKHFLDAEAAAQTPGGDVLWQEYLAARSAALEEQNDRIARALFVKGTDFDVPEDGWDAVQAAIGIDVPADPHLRRAHWLMTEGSAEDISGLITAIMRLTGVPERAISEAEDAFRSSLRDGQEPA